MTRPRREAERGTAILITMLLTIGLLSGGAVLVGMQLSGTRSVDVAKTKTLALHCAEAGVTAARTTVAASYASWTSSLCNPPAPLGTGSCVIGSAVAEPTFLSGISHDIDADTNPDFVITLVDNEDEVPPTANNMSVDNDLQVYVISTCIKYGDIKQQVRELIKVEPGAACINSQGLGCTNSGQ